MMQPPPAGVRQPATMPMGPPSHQGMSSPPVAGGGQPAFQGTLAPGTRVMIGPIIVTVQKYLSQGETALFASKEDLTHLPSMPLLRWLRSCLPRHH